MKKTTITKKALKCLPSDTQYEEKVIQSVKDCGDGIEITADGGCLFIPKTKFVPKVGMKARFYGKGLGYTVRGVVIDGNPIFYRTEGEAEQDHQKWCEKQDKDREKNFAKAKKSLDKEYASLPEFFQKRIDKFRKNNPRFRFDYESYEMFCCKEAIKIASVLKTVEKIDEWKDMGWEEQTKLVEIDEGHSGNTFGAAVYLAKLYLACPDNLVNAHGALSNLVGCKTYGCHGTDTNEDKRN